MTLPTPRSSPRRQAVDGAYIGKVRRLTSPAAVYVELPEVARGYEYGPAPLLEGLATGGLTTDTGSAGGAYDGAPAHTHPLRPASATLKAGDRVAVLMRAGELIVVLGRVP